ncbi:putative thioredoxin reductase [Golovinomyces cichoracearum]|uniref:Putative thioredoxin reductase n=1 Tax=Golovinomyces cichoracearum TaxID=62708 RepID=A0A420IKN2_9PEZI|nr:putative thioredoxin reductase [Golovinomyces cichoracearum]
MILNYAVNLLFVLSSLVLRGNANPVSVEGQQWASKNTESPKTVFDVVIVGGGPAGLSSLSSLARVRRTAMLFDSGEYRNAFTRNNHDVIGSDGMAPSLFRSKAREQIARYPTASFQNETVVSILRSNDSSFFITTVSSGKKYMSRKIILATGIHDILPDTPGIKEAWGRGMYWCAWCDSWEHRDQPIGVIASLPRVISSLLQIKTLNEDIIVFLNGTDTPANRALLDKTSPNWQNQLSMVGAQLENRTIARFERLQDGSVFRNETSWEEYDKFRIHLEDGTQIERSAFLMSLPMCQRSYLGTKIGVKLEDERIVVDSSSMRAAPGVWGIGDANNDGTTNVPHALYTGKKAAVHAHIELAREEITASSVTKRSELDLSRDMENGLENLWDSLKQ